MNVSDHDRLLESVARLTEKRDRESLELCLMQTIFELLPVEEIALYQIEDNQLGLLVRINPEGHWTVSEDHTDGELLIPITDNALFADSLNRREMRVETISARVRRYAFPILYQGQGVGVMSIQSTRDLNEERRMIAGFLRIYQNYLSLIHENAHDKLTGLLNRKTFDERFISIFLKSRSPDPAWDRLRVLERRQDGNDRYWLAILDIDHFKRVNDNFGHLYGDEVLLLVANLMRRSFRRGDLLFRYGGEEFIAVLKTAMIDDTFTVLERFRRTVEFYNFPQVGQITVSIGFTQIADSEIPTPIIERADRALYYAKGNGRNRIHGYEQLITLGALTTSGSQSGGDTEMF